MATTNSNYQKCVKTLTSMKNKYPKLKEEFVKWYEDGGWDDDGLNDEFLEAAEESSFIDWIKENESISTEEQGNEIWQVLHQTIKGDIESGSGSISGSISEEKTKILNPYDSLVVKLLSTQIASSERKKHIESSKSPTKQRITTQSASMLPAASSGGGLFGRKKNQAQDILMCELLGYKNNNYPLLLHFVDAYIRCQLNEWIYRGKKQPERFSSTDFFEKYCANPHFRQYKEINVAQQTIDFVRTAIDSYQKRVLPSFKFMEPIYKINGTALDISDYFFEMARIARNCASQPMHNFTSIIPMQIDFMILNTKIKDVRPRAQDCAGVKALFSDEDWDEEDETKSDDEDGLDENENVSKDLDKLLSDKNIKYHVYKNPLRDMLRCTEDIKRIVDNKRSQRTIFILDRRGNRNKNHAESHGTAGDKLYLFKPRKFNNFEDNYQELIHASLHHNSVNTIVPRSGKGKKDFTVREGLRGQMFVISYHIMSKEEIRCYLFYQGQCFRFYGEDLINVLPIFFLNEKEIHKLLLNKYNHQQKWRKAFDEFADTFIDNKFKMFYHGLTGKIPRIPVIQQKY